MGTAPPKKGVLRRLTARLKKTDKFISFPDFPTEKCSEIPEKLQVDCTAKWTGKRKPKNFKKIRISLENGHLKIRDRGKTDVVGLYSGFNVDLSKTTVTADDRRICIKFTTVIVQLTTQDQKILEKLKESILKHRLFRQEQVQKESAKSSEQRTVYTTNSTTTVSSDFYGWDYDPNCMKVLESIKEMQGLTIQVMEKAAKCLEDIRFFLEENKPKARLTLSATCVTAPLANLKKRVDVSQSISRDEDEDDLSEDMDADTEKELLTPMPPKQDNMLKSMEMARSEAEQQSKRDILTRCKKILDLPKQIKIPSPVISQKKISKKEIKPPNPLKRLRRDVLPAKQSPCEAIGLKILATMFMTRTGMPLTNYEPIGMVQAACEELFWSSLLDQAAVASRPEERMSFVTAFAVGSYMTKCGRFRKPFNPILGETFDYEDFGWKFHGEQVSHHPAISAGYAESKNWSFWITFHLETKFNSWSRSCDLTVEEPLRVRLKLSDGTVEDYSWNKVRSKIENLTSIPEQRKITHDGLMIVHSTSSFTGRVYFKRSKNPMEVTGDVMNPRDVLSYRLHGFWDKSFVRIRTTGEVETLLNSNLLKRFVDYFGFNQFTMGLNEIDSNMPQSDSRYRQDMRSLEYGNIAKATQAKEQLERLQRNRIKAGQSTSTLWFNLITDEMTKKQIYYPNGKYWLAKLRGFSDVKGMIAINGVCS